MISKVRSYETMDTLGKSMPELIVKVYDGAIFNLESAVNDYKEGQSQKGYEAMEKAKKFLVHLYTTLDRDKGGDIAENLGRLYAFVIEQVNLVQSTKNLATLGDSIQILKNLRDGWLQLAQQVKEEKSGPLSEADTGQGGKPISLSI